MGVLKQHCADLEVGLAQEHQNRVRQEREKVGCYACPDNTAANVPQ